jgi:hypothetical protein
MRVRLMVAAFLAGLALAGMPAPASAAPAVHETLPESYDGESSFAAGEGWCVDYAGTMTESRDGVFRVTQVGTGPRSGMVQVMGDISASLTLTPEDPSAGVAYVGGYREHVAGWFIVGPDGDDPRVMSLRLAGVLTGSDGSRLHLTYRIKVTVLPDGDVAVARESLTCR